MIKILFFCYDLDLSKAVIDSYRGVETYLDHRKISILIEAYQRKKGEFNDIVEVDSNGCFCRHFPIDKEVVNLPDEELFKLADEIEKFLECPEELKVLHLLG